MTNSPFSKEANREPNPEPEVIPKESAADKAALIKSVAAEKLQNKQLEAIAGISSLDWTNIPPPILAQLLVQMPFKGGSNEPDFYLAPWQALVFAMRCYELGLSPFSNEVWFNPKNNKVNITFEGKLKLARKQGLDLGPPKFERLTRKMPGNKPGEDYGYKCTMTTSRNGDPAEYTAWHSEWAVASSPVWKAKPDHMLQLRAAEKCLSFASGIGSSELMGEGDLQAGPEATKFMAPEVESTEFVPATKKSFEDGVEYQKNRTGEK